MEENQRENIEYINSSEKMRIIKKPQVLKEKFICENIKELKDSGKITSSITQKLRNEIIILLGIRKTKMDILASLKEKVNEMKEELSVLESRNFGRQADLSQERNNQEK